MSVYEVKMKTHSADNVTSEFEGLNPCILHNRIPTVLKLIYGRRKEVAYTINCDHSDCGRCTSEIDKVVSIWNKWNPINSINKTK